MADLTLEPPVASAEAATRKALRRAGRIRSAAVGFGVVAVLIIQSTILSPPVGLNVFIVKGIVPDVPMYTIFRGIWPFWYAMGLLIVLLLMFPQLALFLPHRMFG